MSEGDWFARVNQKAAACSQGGSVDVTRARGGHLTHVVVSPDGGSFYAIAHGTDNVFVLSAADLCVQAVIPIPSASPFGAMPYRAAVSPDGRTLYTANMGDDTVAVIDLAAQRVLASIPAADIPWDIHLTGDGRRVYVALGNWELVEQSRPGLAVIDAATRTVMDSIAFPHANLAFTVTTTPDGSRVFVASSRPHPDGWHGRLHIIDAGTLAVVNRIDLGPIVGNWGRFAVTRDGRTAYLSAGQQVGRVFVLDVDAGVLKHEIETPGEATEIALSPDEQTLYVLSPGSHRLLSVDPGTRQVATVFDFNAILTGPAGWMSGDTRGLGLSPDGRRAYVGGFEDEAVLVLDLQQGRAAVAPVNARRSELWDLAISPDGRWLYAGENTVEKGLPHSVVVVDTVGNGVAGRIPLPEQSTGLAVTADGRLLYAALLNGEVAEVDLAARRVTRTLRVLPDGVHGPAWDVAPTPDGRLLYATTVWSDSRDGSVAVVDLGTGKVVQRIDPGWLPQMLATAPDGRWVYVSRYGAQQSLGERFNPADIEWFTRAALATIETATHRLVSTVAAEKTFAPAGRIDLLETDSRGERVYFYTRRDEVSVLDTATGRVVQRIDLLTGRHGPVGVHPSDVALLPGGSRAYIPNGDSYLLAVAETGTARIVDWIKLGLEPVAAVVRHDGRYAYVTNRRSEEISVVDLSTNSVAARIGVRR